MTPLQKMAWIEACLWITATLVFLGLLFSFGPAPAPAAFGLVGLLPLARYAVPRSSRARVFGLRLDERDRQISATATRHGLATSYVAFVAVIVGVQQYSLRTGDCVSAPVLMAVFWLVVTVQALVRAASVIAQSRSQEVHDVG